MLLPRHSLESSVLGGWAAEGSPELVSEPGHLLSDHRSTQLSLLFHPLVHAGGFAELEVLGI